MKKLSRQSAASEVYTFYRYKFFGFRNQCAYTEAKGEGRWIWLLSRAPNNISNQKKNLRYEFNS